MMLGDKNDGDSEKFICKLLAGTNLDTEYYELLIKLWADPLARSSNTVGNHKSLNIFFVSAFQKGLQSFVGYTSDLTSAVETTCT